MFLLCESNNQFKHLKIEHLICLHYFILFTTTDHYRKANIISRTYYIQWFIFYIFGVQFINDVRKKNI